MLPRKCFPLLILFILLFIPFTVQGQEKTVPKLEPMLTSDLLKIKIMSQIDVSPDGQKAVFVVTSMGKDDKGNYKYFRHLWMKDLTKSSPPIQLTFGDRTDGSPSWSPDGLRIAFVRAHKEKPQIWLLHFKGGEAYPITEVETGIFRPQWSPDGKKILFSSSIPEWQIQGNPSWPYERPGRKRQDVPDWKKIIKSKKKDSSGDTIKPKPDGTLEEIRAWLAKNASENDPRVINRLNFQGELDLQPELSYSHLFVIESKPGSEAKQITSGFQDFASADWSPDGAKIVCASLKYDLHPDRIIDGDLWMLNSDGTNAELFLDWEGYIARQPLFSPDGQTILFVASDRKNLGYALNQLATVSVKGGKPKPLTFDFDRTVRRPFWAPDGKTIFFLTMNEGAFPLCRISADGGRVETAIDGQIGIYDYDIGADKIVYSVAEVKNPWELYMTGLYEKNDQRITSFNHEWVSKKKISIPQVKWLTRPDGFKVQYWVMEPANKKPGRKYPIVLEMHGGPSAMWGPGEFSMWHEFQLLASWGYGVVYSNPRGSSGYGFEFKHANYRDWGTSPAGDILAAASEAAILDWADHDQQVITGGSYAGYMTAWIVSQDHRFKAAVAQRGVYDISVFFGESNAWFLLPFHFGGYPWEKEAGKYINANSPLTFVDNIRTPLLIIHADRDLRAGVIQSEILYKSLKVLKRSVEYVRYPKEGHELSRSGNPKRRMDRLNRIIEFFERYIKH
ncbi:MAG: S9 family peptidase [Candidatus Aminicenantes bacterium]|nr:MAG: S9 family peptidase [Candidatus Aminicenantes bacterium]